jgi:hypothetical protein
MTILHKIFFDPVAKTVKNKKEIILDVRVTNCDLRWTKTLPIVEMPKKYDLGKFKLDFSKIIDCKRFQTKMHINISYLLKNRYKRYKRNCV